MRVTMGNMLKKKVTIQYPTQRRPVSARYRGMFYLKWNEEKQRLNCVGCTLCAQACPTDVFQMRKVGKGTDAGVDIFTMDLGRCLFCDLCVEACPFDAIYMGPEYEFATYDRDGCVLDIHALTKNGGGDSLANEETIYRLAKEAEEKAAAKAKPGEESAKEEESE
jgi:NADH-quinone oxidoreductase subunit I